MEGLYFEVKPKRGEPHKPGIAANKHPNLTSNHRSCPSFSYLTTYQQCPQKLARWDSTATVGENIEEDKEDEIRYKLTLIGSLPVHHLTTRTMLPWVVAEISRSRPAGKEPVAGGWSELHRGGQLDSSTSKQTVFLCVSASWVRCVSIVGQGVVWDPLTHTLLFECRPHQVTKLIHNSQERSSFGCLVRVGPSCACYVFQCQARTKVGVCVHKQDLKVMSLRTPESCV